MISAISEASLGGGGRATKGAILSLFLGGPEVATMDDDGGGGGGCWKVPDELEPDEEIGWTEVGKGGGVVVVVVVVVVESVDSVD